MIFAEQRALGKQYMTLLFDSLQLLDSGDCRNKNAARSLYRSSIISCILSLECVANICAYSLSLEKRLYDEIEKLGTISKLDFFSYVKCGKNIDYSLNQYQKATELIKIRNDYVHPKVLIGSFNEEHEGEFETYKGLNISKDIRKWTLLDVQKVLDAKIDFLNYFFIDLCKLDAGKLTTLFTCYEEILHKNNISSFIGVSEQRYKLLEKYVATKIKYINIRVIEDKV